jgi:hypothetical protein
VGVEEWQTWCPNCQRPVLGRRDTPNHILHFLISFFTCGLWVVAWIILAVSATRAPYRCSICGTPGQNA